MGDHRSHEAEAAPPSLSYMEPTNPIAVPV